MASEEEKPAEGKKDEVPKEDEDVDHDFEIVDKDEVDETTTAQAEETPPKEHKGLWIGIDLGTSNCACAIWDSNRGRPKWMRLQNLAPKQSNGKVGRIVPSAVLVKEGGDEDALWQDICKWNSDADLSPPTFVVGQTAMANLQEQLLNDDKQQQCQVIKSMKRVLGVCYTNKLKDLDPELRESLPFELEETKDGEWVVPIKWGKEQVLYLQPVHVAAVLLQAIREAAKVYLKRAIPKKKLSVPGYDKEALEICNVVVGVPAYFGHVQRQAVEEAARLAGYGGHVSTLTESTAAAMAYGLFVAGGGGGKEKKAVLVLDMGGGTTDITIAHMNNNNNNSSSSDAPDQKFSVILTDGDSRLGGEDMDQALFELVLKKTASGTEVPRLTAQQRQQLLRSCQQAKELLCGDVDHDDPPADSATVQVPSTTTNNTVELTLQDLVQAIQPLLDRTALLMERTLKRYEDKTNASSVIAEAILIGGATRVPALREMLKQKFFTDIELCTSVNAMSAVAQGTAIQAAILSQQVPLHELRSAMMLDTMPHAIGALLKSGEEERFVQVLARDASLPAVGFGTFYVNDLDQKGVTVATVERIEQDNHQSMYQPLGDFTFLLHRLTEPQRDAIMEDKEHPGLRPVDIGMTLGIDGAFQVSIFDPNDPDHRRKKKLLQKMKQDATEPGLLDYVQAAADLKDDGMTMEETKLIVVVFALFVFYILVKVLLSKEDILSEEDMARIL